MNPPDERRGVPSASGMDRLMNCPASYEMERLAPRDEGNEDAASGTRIHAVLAGFAGWDTLTAAEQETCEMCEAQAHTVIDSWSIGECGLTEPTAFIYEQRLGLTALGAALPVTPESRAQFLFTGQADLILINGDSALVIDYKTGRGDTPIAQDNQQLAALAVLVWKRYKVSSVRVAIVQPWACKPTVADHSTNALTLAEGWLQETLTRAATATPDDRRAGDWCKYCKARFACDTFKTAVIQDIERIQPMSIAGLPPNEQGTAMYARAMEFSPQQHEGAYLGLAMVKRYVHAIESSFKARVEAGEVPGWKIESKPGNREITDAQKAYNALEPLGVTHEDVLEACSLPIGAMEEAVRKRSGIKSQTEKRTVYNLTAKETKERVSYALEAVGAIDRKADKQEVVRMRELEGGDA